MNAIVAIWLGNHYMTVMMVLLAGSLLGFLRWNFHPRAVFLGDTGSLSLGMFLAARLLLQSPQKARYGCADPSCRCSPWGIRFLTRCWRSAGEWCGVSRSFCRQTAIIFTIAWSGSRAAPSAAAIQISMRRALSSACCAWRR